MRTLRATSGPIFSAALAAILAMLGAGAPSNAATLPFDSRLQFLVSVGGEQHGFLVSGTGSGVAFVNGSGVGSLLASLEVPASAAQAEGLYLFSDAESFPVNGVVIDAHNAAGSFSGAPLGGAMELRGTAKACLFYTCTDSVSNLTVPLSLIGQPGTHTVPALLPMTVVGAPWTTGTVGVGTTLMGFVHGPASATSTAAQPGGVVVLVTPTYITTSVGIEIIMLTQLTIEFVPEPGTLLLVGSGTVALAARGRQIRRIVNG